MRPGFDEKVHVKSSEEVKGRKTKSYGMFDEGFMEYLKVWTHRKEDDIVDESYKKG